MARPFFFGGNQSSQQSQYLVQMKAGKMVKNGNMVSPIKDRKGLLYLHQNAEDNLMHFCWKDRQTGQLEDDLIMFPDDAEFLKVPQCTTGRVFVLKFKTSSRRLFFWSQEPKDDKDDEIVSKINEYINNPMAATNAANRNNASGGTGNAGSGGSGGALMSASDLGLGSDEEFRNLFSNANMSAQQLMSMLDAGLAVLPHGGAGRLASLLGSVQNASSNNSSRNSSSNGSTIATGGTAPTLASSDASNTASGGNNSPATPGATNSTTTTPTAGLQLSDLQNIISGLSQTAGGGGGAAGNNQQSSDNDLNIDLSTSINVEVLRPLLSNDDFMKRISDMLPSSSNDSSSSTQTPLSEQFISTVASPQFQQALNSFSHALQSGQLGPLIQQFGLPESCVTAANNGNFEAFVKALQSSKTTTGADSDKKKDADNKGGEHKKDDDDSMALD